MALEKITELSMQNRFLIFTGIFLVSMSGLMLEISITRVFSAAIWYHHAFLAVSLALLGFGSSGLFLHFRSKNDDRWLSSLAIFASIAIAASVPVLLLIMNMLSSQVQYLPLFLILSAIPFFFVGLVIVSAFNTFAHIAGKLYFADLIGASLGSLIVVFALTLLGGEGSILFVGVIVSVGAIIFAYVSKHRKMVALTIGALCVSSVLLAVNDWTEIFSIPTHLTAQKDLPTYLREHPDAKIVKTEWNSFSRIDVVEGGKGEEGLLAKIFIDGGAGMNVMQWDGNTNSRNDLATWMQYLPFSLMESPKVLIIGSGGGRDVLASLASGSKDVTAVEINPIIFNTVKEYGSRAGNIYDHPYVNANLDEGRSFVTRSNERYDIIYIPFVDTWASISSGGLSLSENYIYTKEAFHEYYDHLSDRGKIVVVRWLIDSPRLVSTFSEILQDNGVPTNNVYKHVVVVSQKSITEDPSETMVILSKKPFTQSELEFLSTSFSAGNYKPIILPNYVILEPYNKLLKGQISSAEFYNLFDHRVHPVSDDSPYFLTTEKPLPWTLIMLLYTSLGIVALFICAPLLHSFRKGRNEIPNALKTLPYFAALGIGFMLIEVAMLQKLILLLGNPTATLAILLFTLLLAGGAGSLASTRIMQQRTTKNLTFIIGGIAILVLLYAVIMTPIISTFLSQPFLLRVLVSVAILAPLGFLLGIPFPTGMRIVKTYFPSNVPWMWAINGAFSVLGAVLATSIGIMYGLSWSLVLGVIAYCIAFGIAATWKKKSQLTQIV